jgi:SSS family solute:Na+ symporter
MPKIWRAGRQHGLITQADFFAARFGARWLGVVTGAVGIAALVLYVQIQLVSLSLIVQLTVGNAVSPTAAVILGAVLMLAFVVLAGLRSAAFSAAIKDILMIVIVVLLSVTVAGKVGASSPLDVLRLVENAHPGIAKFP